MTLGAGVDIGVGEGVDIGVGGVLVDTVDVGIEEVNVGEAKFIIVKVISDGYDIFIP